MNWRRKLDGGFSFFFFFMSLYCFIAKTAVTGRPKRGESQKASREEAHSLETACSGAGGIGSSGGKFLCVAVFIYVLVWIGEGNLMVIFLFLYHFIL